MPDGVSADIRRWAYVSIDRSTDSFVFCPSPLQNPRLSPHNQPVTARSLYAITSHACTYYKHSVDMGKAKEVRRRRFRLSDLHSSFPSRLCSFFLPSKLPTQPRDVVILRFVDESVVSKYEALAAAEEAEEQEQEEGVQGQGSGGSSGGATVEGGKTGGAGASGRPRRVSMP